MRRIFIMAVTILSLGGCNSVYMKPGTLDPNQVIYAERGGYTIRRVIKRTMEERGYKVVVGKAKSKKSLDGEEIDMSTVEIPTEARYVTDIYERKERFAPIWCAFNGFWWWRFNVSIADQKTNEEILTWFGYGCANSTVRKLETILDELEVKNAE